MSFFDSKFSRKFILQQGKYLLMFFLIGSDHSDFIEHHIAQNSSSDEIFLDDDEDESFSSLIPESAKDSNIEEIKLNSNFKLKSSEKYLLSLNL